MCQALFEVRCMDRLIQSSSLLFRSSMKQQCASTVFPLPCVSNTSTNHILPNHPPIHKNIQKLKEGKNMIMKSFPPFSTEFSIVHFILQSTNYLVSNSYGPGKYSVIVITIFHANTEYDLQSLLCMSAFAKPSAGVLYLGAHMSVSVFEMEVLCVISPKQMFVSRMALIYFACLLKIV